MIKRLKLFAAAAIFCIICAAVAVTLCALAPFAVLIWPELWDGDEVKPVRKSEGYVKEVKS